MEIGWSDTKGTFHDRDYKPGEVYRLQGVGKRVYEYLEANGFNPSIEGREEDYFGNYPVRSTGFEICANW